MGPVGPSGGRAARGLRPTTSPVPAAGPCSCPRARARGVTTTPAPVVVDALDALVLVGGGDVDPARYGQDAASRHGGGRRRTRRGRSWRCWRRRSTQDLPVLAICRGMQLLDVHLGGTLRQHLPDVVGHDAAPARRRVASPTSPCDGTGLAGGQGPRGRHHRALLAPPGAGPPGRGPGGHGPRRRRRGRRPSSSRPRRFVVGVQWHPEEDDDLRLFEALVGAGREPSPGDAGRPAAAGSAPAAGRLRGVVTRADEQLRGHDRARREPGDRAATVAELARRAPRRPTPPSAGPRGRSRRGATSPPTTGPACCAVSPERSRPTPRSSPCSRPRNVGKPIADSRGEVAMVADVLHFYAGAVDKHRGSTDPGGRRRRPHLARGPRRGGGHRAVELPLGHRLVEGGPRPGLRQHRGRQARRAHAAHGVALGRARPRRRATRRGAAGRRGVGARRWGSALVEHPDVAKVAFTGSTEAGRDVMARAAGTVKRVTLELGGKSANVVFADADLERAAASAPLAVFGNAGQDCCARSRDPGRAHASSTGSSSCSWRPPRRWWWATPRTPPRRWGRSCRPSTVPEWRRSSTRPSAGVTVAGHRRGARRPRMVVPAHRPGPGGPRRGCGGRRSSVRWWR